MGNKEEKVKIISIYHKKPIDNKITSVIMEALVKKFTDLLKETDLVKKYKDKTLIDG